MRVALLTTFAASKKEPLIAMMNRVHQAFATAGLKEPAIRCTFPDAPVQGSTSAVTRALKRHPELQRFVTDAPLVPGLPGMLRISNADAGAPCESIPCQTLEALAGGVPRSFPFHGVVIHFVAHEFGILESGPAGSRGRCRW